MITPKQLNRAEITSKTAFRQSKRIQMKVLSFLLTGPLLIIIKIKTFYGPDMTVIATMTLSHSNSKSTTNMGSTQNYTRN